MNDNGKIEITDALLVAYINGELDSAAAEKVKAWISESEENTERFNEVAKTWEISGKVEPKPVVVNTESAWENVLGQISEDKGKVIPMGKTSNRRVYWAIAAMIVAIFGVFSILKLTADVDTVIRVAEVPGLVDELPDGSVVTLNANTSLSYPETFATNERRVELKGEAFFDIERNEEKPFIIGLPADAHVKVLGTSFNIRAVEGDSLTEVFVSTGKVEFGRGDSVIILTAGQKGILNNATGELKSLKNEISGVSELYWMEEELSFDGVALNEVVDILNELYPEKVRLTCDSVASERFTSDFNKDKTLREILEVIAETNYLEVSESTVDGQKEFILDCNGF